MKSIVFDPVTEARRQKAEREEAAIAKDAQQLATRHDRAVERDSARTEIANLQAEREALDAERATFIRERIVPHEEKGAELYRKSADLAAKRDKVSQRIVGLQQRVAECDAELEAYIMPDDFGRAIAAIRRDETSSTFLVTDEGHVPISGDGRALWALLNYERKSPGAELAAWRKRLAEALP